MSMREYSLRDAGFLIDAEVAAYACLSMDKTTKSVPEAIQVCLDDGTFAEKARAGALPEDYSDVDMVIDFFNALPEDVGTCVDAPPLLRNGGPRPAGARRDSAGDGVR